MCARSDGEIETYPNAPVQAPRHQVDVVELEARDGARVTDQGPVHLAGPQVPEADEPVGGAAGQGGVEDLEGANKV